MCIAKIYLHNSYNKITGQAGFVTDLPGQLIFFIRELKNEHKAEELALI